MAEINQKLSDKIIQVLESLDLGAKKPIALHEPRFTGNEWSYLNDCLGSGYVSSVGPFVSRFENDLKKITGAKYVIATNSGTAALHINLLLAGVKRNHEVLTPALSFIATTNAIRYCQAIPHFVDICHKNLAVDPNKLSEYLKSMASYKNGQCINRVTKRVIKALCVTHIFGHPADLASLANICREYEIELLEDAAEALGSYYQDNHVGHYGCAGALSFNGNKIITTGGGGAILTNHRHLAELARHLTTQAKVPHAWNYEHDKLGFNYRMPNLNAALGCAQLENLTNFLLAKRSLAETYQHAFFNMEEMYVMKEPMYAKSNYWLNAIILTKANIGEFESLVNKLNEKQWSVRPLWMLHHRLPMYSCCPRMDLSASESFENRVINLPSSAFLNKEFQIEASENLCCDRISC